MDDKTLRQLMIVIVFIVGLISLALVALSTIFRQFIGQDSYYHILFGATIALFCLTAIGIVVPHIIIFWREDKSSDWQEEINRLKQEIETLKRNQADKR